MLSRRSFFRISGTTAAGAALAPYISGRGLEAMVASGANLHAAPSVIRLDSNENPNGPGPAALRALQGAFGESNRYPKDSTFPLPKAIAQNFGLKTENVVLGCGSTDILRASVHAFCDSTHGLVTCAPGFETTVEVAKFIGSPIRAVPVTGDLKLDLDAMAAAARGAGLVYFCNPNNPTSTVHGKDAVMSFVNKVLKDSPNTTIMIDEAYHEYVDDPSYATSIPIAMNNPRVFIARTFSKVYGMAGLRVGYALGDARTMKQLAPHTMEMGVNQLGAFAASYSIADHAHVQDEQKSNRIARAFTLKGFRDMGYKVADSQANFMMVDLRRNAQPFRDACRKEGVLVGRPFPPLENHCRITISTLNDMTKAMEVFRSALSTRAASG